MNPQLTVMLWIDGSDFCSWEPRDVGLMGGAEAH